MNVWFINPYGNLPGENWLPHRSYMACNAFAKDGHNVVYWISNIDHRSKDLRSSENCKLLQDGMEIRILQSTRYKEHISLQRVLFEINFIKNFCKTAALEKNLPDFILIGDPALFISFNFIKFVNKYKIPFIVDIGDLWPELFKIALPRPLRRFEKLIFSPLYFKRHWFLNKAAGIISVSDAYLEIAKKLNNAGFFKRIYWGVNLENFKNGISVDIKYEKEIDEFWLIYAGTLGDNYDTKGLMECAKLLESSNTKYRLFIAGDGNLKYYVQDFIRENKLKKTIFLGRVEPSFLVSFYKKCDVALSTYAEGSTVSMPIKAFDYLAAGLPMINSLGYDLRSLIEKYQLGFNYKAGNHIELFNKIKLLIHNKSNLEIFKKNCLEISETFHEPILYKSYVDFCISVIYSFRRHGQLK
jgi:glycosyltransferase involved in cell wall biosynthesis